MTGLQNIESKDKKLTIAFNIEKFGSVVCLNSIFWVHGASLKTFYEILMFIL